MKDDPKSPDQLQREIAYFKREVARSHSLDRKRRAISAITLRERLLEALRRRVPPRVPAP